MVAKTKAAVSMPGMMATILNVGLCEPPLPALIRLTGNPRHACRLGSRWFHEGDLLTLDGQSGAVYAGQLDVVTEKPLTYLQEINRWKALLGEKDVPAGVS